MFTCPNINLFVIVGEACFIPIEERWNCVTRNIVVDCISL